MFKKFGSESLIWDLSWWLEPAVWVPGDYIVVKDDLAEEMYFIAEGTVYVIAEDKRTVVSVLDKGWYFGEMGILLNTNVRMAYIQAKTLCNILILQKTHVDQIRVNFPTVA